MTLPSDVEAGVEATQLVRDMGAKSWSVRQAAVASLAERPGGEVVAAVLGFMRDDHRNLELLNSAILLLTRSGVDALAPLQEFLHGPDRDLRSYAAIILGEQNNPRAIPALLRALADADANVRYHAIEALGKLRAGAASDRLAAVAESRDFFLAFPALAALASISDGSVAHRIVPLLEDPFLSPAAIETLGQIGDEEVVDLLAGKLHRSDSPIAAIAGALAALSHRYEEACGDGTYIARLALPIITPSGKHNLIAAAEQASERELNAIAVIVGWLAGPDVDPFLLRLFVRPNLRNGIAEVLVRRGAVAIDSLIESLNADDIDTQRAAVLALGRIGNARALPALLGVLGTDNGLTVALAGALAMIGDAAAYGPLREYLGHPSASVRQAAVSALNAIGHPDLANDLLRMLSDANPNVRECAVKINTYFGFPECAESLLAACRDAQVNVRCAAVECLPQMDDDRAMTALRAALQDSSPRVRATAARTLGQCGGQETASLRSALNDADPWVRYFSARAIGRQGDPEALGVLRKLARDDQAMQVRVAAIEALGYGRCTDDIGELALLTESSHDDLARAALAALGSMQRPEALPPVIKAASAETSATRAEAIRALGASGVSEAVQTLRLAALDPDEAVAQASLHALRQLAKEESIAALVELSTYPQCRDACIVHLKSVDESQLIWVAKGLTDSQGDVRRSVIAALARSPYPTARNYLRAACEDADASVRFAAIRALSHSRASGGRV
jgi:HEAT repeat protein